MRRFLQGAVLAALLTGAADAALAAPPADLDAFVAQSMKTFGPPGMTVAVVEDGKVALARGYGVRSLAGPARVDEHTIFPIGSETKAFTATALAILVDAGKLKWSDRVAGKLPGFRMYDPYATANMTVRDLLTHRSGLGLGEGDLLIVPSTTRSRADIVHALRYLKPATGFRESFAYDNILYIVAGALVEAVSSESWEGFIQKHIFAPVGMKDAMTAHDIHARNGIALHARTDGPIRGLGAQRILLHGLEGGASAPAGRDQCERRRHGAVDAGPARARQSSRTASGSTARRRRPSCGSPKSSCRRMRSPRRWRRSHPNSRTMRSAGSSRTITATRSSSTPAPCWARSRRSI